MEVKLREINNVWERIDTLYHEVARKFGLSDADFHILYILYRPEEYVPQKEIYQQTGISKSTINSAVKKMEQEGIIKINAIDGRSTQVGLTSKGRKLSSKNVEKIIEIENRIYDSWSEEKRETMLNVNKDFMEAFASEVERL